MFAVGFDSWLVCLLRFSFGFACFCLCVLGWLGVSDLCADLLFDGLRCCFMVATCWKTCWWFNGFVLRVGVLDSAGYC